LLPLLLVFVVVVNIGAIRIVGFLRITSIVVVVVILH
jgi:hypothetical protein